jgi:hypothetical protein
VFGVYASSMPRAVQSKDSREVGQSGVRAVFQRHFCLRWRNCAVSGERQGRTD